jgi:site-specific recombinase XerD
MKIHIRKKAISKDRHSLYLEFYDKGSRSFEFLDLYTSSKAKLTPFEKKRNKDAFAKAELIKSTREYEIYTGTYKTNKNPNNELFIDYFKRVTKNKGNYHKYVWKTFSEFIRRDIKIDEINTQILEGYRDYLQIKYSPKTVFQFITSIKIVVNQAISDGIIVKNPFLNFDNVKVPASKREYLTLEELRKLNTTPCNYLSVKKSFLSACYCGLRISDLRQLQYDNIIDNQIVIFQKKTKEIIYIPINEHAYKYIDKSKIGEGIKVFDLPSSTTCFYNIKKWADHAKINKNISYHVARHTFATLQLSFGTDIYTVSKLLGHKNLETTQIYAKIVDKTKVDAINRMPPL